MDNKPLMDAGVAIALLAWLRRRFDPRDPAYEAGVVALYSSICNAGYRAFLAENPYAPAAYEAEPVLERVWYRGYDTAQFDAAMHWHHCSCKATAPLMVGCFGCLYRRHCLHEPRASVPTASGLVATANTPDVMDSVLSPLANGNETHRHHDPATPTTVSWACLSASIIDQQAPSGQGGLI